MQLCTRMLSWKRHRDVKWVVLIVRGETESPQGAMGAHFPCAEMSIVVFDVSRDISDTAATSGSLTRTWNGEGPDGKRTCELTALVLVRVAEKRLMKRTLYGANKW